LKPIEVLGANGEEAKLYIDVKPFVFEESIMLIPISGLVDIFSVEVALQIINQVNRNQNEDLIYLTEVNSPDDDLHGTKAFAIDLKKSMADYDKTNRKERGTEEEYNLAKQKLVSAVSLLFEAKKRFARNILSRL